MPIVQVKAELSFDQLVEAVRQLSENERERLLAEVSDTRHLRENRRMSDVESEIIAKINQEVPEPLQRRFDELVAKRTDGALTDEEYEELLELTDQVELLDAKRVEYLTELAAIRRQTLSDLMDELKIKPPPVHA